MQKIKVFEAFSGIGAQAMACKRLQKMFPDKVEFEFVGISEIAPDACAAYKAVHGDIPNYGDISKIDWAQVPDFDLFTWSSPCQDFSQAGKQAGAIEGSGTRSSLLWECFRAFEVKRPKYLLFENVAAVLSRKFKPMFLQVVDRLGSLGYTNFWQVLDSKDYGVPQHRERVFMVSILGDKATFEFPKPFPLEKRLRDVLEDNVAESYYLKDEQVAKILEHSERKQAQGRGFKNPQCGRVYSVEGISPTLNTYGGGDREPKILIVGSYSPTSACNGKVLDANGISPTLLDHKGAEPAILVPKRTEKAKELRRQGIEVFANRELVPREDGCSNTITTVTHDNLVLTYEKRKEPIQIGDIYGRLTVLSKMNKKQGSNYMYLCRCECGNTCEVNGGHLGITTMSCGCLKGDSHRTHGQSKSRLYNIWSNMKKRCLSHKCPNYEKYGGRGIKVCEEWMSFEPFFDWAISNGYSEELTLDRIDNNGDYSPQNCRWATYSQQSRNRSIWGEIPYEGIVKDSTGYRAQIMVNGQKVYIAHSVSDIEFLVNARNEYIKTHKLPHRLQEYNKDNLLQETYILGYTRDSMGNIQNYHERDIAGTLHTSTGSGGNTDQFVKEMIIQNAHGYNKGGLFEDISPTVTSSAFQNNNFVIKKYRIRRLTEREVFRLMGMDDADIDKIDAYRIRKTLKNGKVKEKPISKSARYRCAGNSIVVNVLTHIFYQMFIAEPPKPQPKQLTLFD